MVIQLLAGMFIGSIIAWLLWGFILKSGKSKADKAQREREAIMRSVGELWVEIDSLISSHRNGSVEEHQFKETFSSKIEAINGLLKPNLHILDVFYVKYNENLVAEYNRVVLKGGVPETISATSSASVEAAAGGTSDIEMETNFSVVEQPESADLLKSAAADKPDAGAGATGSESVISSGETAPVIEADSVPEFQVSEKETSNVSEDEMVFSPGENPQQEAIFESDSTFSATSELEVAVPPKNEAVTEEAQIDVKSPPAASEAVTSIVDEAEIFFEKTTSATSEDAPAPPEEVEFFEAPVKVSSDTEAPDEAPVSFEKKEIAKKKSADVEKKSTVSSLKEKKEKKRHPKASHHLGKDASRDAASEKTKAPEKKAEGSDEAVFEASPPTEKIFPDAVKTATEAAPAAAAHELFEEEEFSMETLMDVDIHNISHFLKTPPEGTGKPKKEEKGPSLFDASSNAAASVEPTAKEGLEVVIASHVSHTETPVRDESQKVNAPAEKPVSEKKREKGDDAIPEETTLTKADELENKDRKKEPAAEDSSVADFEAIFDQKVKTVQEKSPSGADLFETDSSLEDMITGDDVAETIAALEFNKPDNLKKAPAKKEKKKEVAILQKTTVKKAAITDEKKPSSAAAPKGKDDSITGDDVADQIDSFFGLFKD